MGSVVRGERGRQLLGARWQDWAATVSLLTRRDRAFPLVGDSIGIILAKGLTFWAAARAVGVPLDLTALRRLPAAVAPAHASRAVRPAVAVPA